MICHIVQNGGYMFLFLLLYMVVGNSIKENVLTVQEFCFGNHLLHNIEPGEPYVLTLKSDFSDAVNKLYHKLYKRKCRQEFKTSDSSAHFEISITNMNIPSCLNSSCRCNYFEISVSGHSKRFCGSNDDSFTSRSDTLTIDFNPKYAMPFDVTLTFNVEKNFYIISGSPNDASMPSNIIETPYFPNTITPKYKAEYILQSNPSDVHVMLLFLDFLISPKSFLEIAGQNGTHTTRFYGDVFRPPVILSDSNELSLKVETSDEHMSGFRAEVWFIKSVDSLSVPVTECGGRKDASDGIIHIETQEGFHLYDCVWHIMPSFTKLNLSLFVHLRNISHKSHLEFRQGHYSKSNIIKKIDCETENCTILDNEIVFPPSDSLYIRFRGYLDMNSVVNMSYNTFYRGDCLSSDFRCNDGRCLKSGFQCDNIQQCPDGADEVNCSSVAEDGVFQYPGIKHEDYYHTLPVGYIWVMVIGSIGVILVLGVFFVFLYTCCKQGITTSQLFSQQVVVSELPAIQPVLYPIDSCGCDNPPSYEDFIKSSENYPHLQYNTADCFIPNNFTQCTSFCTGARVRHYSADSFNVRCENDLSLNVTRESSPATQSVNSNGCNIEINHNIIFEAPNVKKAYSLDSKLNVVNKDSRNFCLSIIHPVCTHMPDNHHVQCCALPTNLNMNASKTSSCNEDSMNRSVTYESNSTVNVPKDRGFTLSYVPHGSEILTIVKTRCFSDPCKGISVRCSLY